VSVLLMAFICVESLDTSIKVTTLAEQ